MASDLISRVWKMASDLISREVLIDELKEDVEFESPTFNQCVNSAMSSAFRIAIKRVKAAPAVDAVEVVRCKDCIASTTYSGAGERDVLWCKRHGSIMCCNGFCSNGSRRKEDAVD